MNNKKIFICRSEDYEKNSAFYCAGIIFDLGQTKKENIKEFFKRNNMTDWVVVDYKNKEKVILDTRIENNFDLINKYFENKMEYQL